MYIIKTEQKLEVKVSKRNWGNGEQGDETEVKERRGDRQGCRGGGSREGKIKATLKEEGRLDLQSSLSHHFSTGSFCFQGQTILKKQGWFWEWGVVVEISASHCDVYKGNVRLLCSYNFSL